MEKGIVCERRIEEAERENAKVVEAQAAQHVFVAMVHAEKLLGVVGFFLGYLDEFMEKGSVREEDSGRPSGDCWGSA